MDDDDDNVRLRKLFAVTQAVMIQRNQLLEDAMNEAEAEAKKSLKKGNFNQSALSLWFVSLS